MRAEQGTVAAVSCNDTYAFTKPVRDEIVLIAGVGVAGDVHAGVHVKHRGRVRADPTQPNFRQVHLIQQELFAEVGAKGYTVAAGNLGENVTTSGIDLLALPVGTILRFGPPRAAGQGAAAGSRGRAGVGGGGGSSGVAGVLGSGGGESVLGAGGGSGSGGVVGVPGSGGGEGVLGAGGGSGSGGVVGALGSGGGESALSAGGALGMGNAVGATTAVGASLGARAAQGDGDGIRGGDGGSMQGADRGSVQGGDGGGGSVRGDRDGSGSSRGDDAAWPAGEGALKAVLAVAAAAELDAETAASAVALAAAAARDVGDDPRAAVVLAGLRNPCGQINGFREGLLKEVIGRDEDGRVVRKAGVMAVVLRGGPVRPGYVVTAELPPPPHAPLERV